MIELLAPAKNKICAKAAINCGADAIYIGASEFGARNKAPNSLEDIKEIVEYAHRFNVRVYITLNTILTDTEILQAKDLIDELYQIGADAIIIQDMGLLELDLPPIALFASTQCDNRTPQKVKFLENAGFSRVILARELSLEQIKEIRKQTTVELEGFVHGALCVSYSGQCYLSYAIGGRSANRGECAQPCRKNYSLVDEEGNYIAKDKPLLCLKDFNASKHITGLVNAGVSSFKIEGRLKDENYVKNVVAYYRKLIDDLGYQKTSSGKVLLDFEPDVEKSFNRGFTDYFLAKRNKCFTFDSPKSRGKYMGKVTKVENDYFEIDASLNPQDGLCYLAKDGLLGCLVNKIEEVKENNHHVMLNSIQHRKGERQCDPESHSFLRRQAHSLRTTQRFALSSSGRRTTYRVYPYKMEGIKVGTKIYRNVDAEFEKALKNSKTCRKIGANLIFKLNKISATDEDGNTAEVEYEFEEFANSKEKMSANVVKQLSKSGESDFLVENVEVLADKIPFLPVSKLNELRRELLEELMQVRLNNYKKITLAPCDSAEKTIKYRFREEGQGERSYPDKEIDYRGNVLNNYAKKFYQEHGCKIREMALESGEKCGGKCVMTSKHCLKWAFNMCKSPKNLTLIDEKGKRYPLKFNCDKCEMEIYF